FSNAVTTAVCEKVRFASMPEMRTFEPARNSDPEPCVSNELRISGPYQCDIRCGTKKTKMSSGGAATIWVSTILLIDSKPMYHERSRTQVSPMRRAGLFHKFRRFTLFPGIVGLREENAFVERRMIIEPDFHGRRGRRLGKIDF